MKKEAEASHMQNAIDDMQNIKAQVSTIQAASASGNGFSASSPLELGGGSIPVIDPSSSSGTVTIDPAYGNFSITAYFNNGTAQNPNFSVSTRGPAPMGRLIYTANNHYYTDQLVNYECGLMVLSQYGGNTSISSPPISVIKVANDPTTMAIVAANPPRVIGSPQSLSSTGQCNIRTTILPYSNVINTNKVTNVTLVVKSNYSQLWYAYFNQIMDASGLVKETNYNVTRMDSNTVRLWVQGNGLDNDIILSSIDSLVITQIDGSQPGVVINPSPTAVPTQVPVASILASPTKGPAPLPVSFRGSGTNSPTSFEWDFGDGSAHSTGSFVYHTYNTPGLYNVTLIASNAAGSSAPAAVQINVTVPVPVASINAVPTSGPAPLTVNFQGSGTNSPTSFDWTFGDGSNHGSGASVSHTYNTPGVYQVVLIAANAGGNSAPVVATINVGVPVPVASIIATPTSGTAPQTVNFQGSGTNSPTTFEWDFGDGSAHAFGTSVSHTYANADTYTATLIASNAGGPSAPATARITANRPVVSETLYLLQSGSMSTSLPSGGTTKIYFPLLGLYQGKATWTSPVFASDYVIQNPTDSYVYAERNGLLTLITSKSATLELVSASGGRTTIASASDGELLTLELTGADVSMLKLSMSQPGPITVPKGSHLELTVSCYSLVGLSSLDIYEGSTYPSRVSMSTPTYISVSDLKLYDTSNNPVSSIPQSGNLRVWANVTDPFGTADIQSVTLAIYSPSGSTIYGPTAMTSTATDTSSTPAWKKYQNDLVLGTGLSKGTYTVVVKATDTNGITVSKTQQITVS
jgi:PKD repeat protein